MQQGYYALHEHLTYIYINNSKTYIMRKLIMVMLVMLFGLTIQTFAQNEIEKLSEVEILGVNYKYLNDLGDKEVATPVKILEKKAAKFDLKNADFYEDETQRYNVYFMIPDGKILAVYDGDGEIIRTSEKFKDVKLPISVANAVVDAYPGWHITGDIYLVTYHRNKGAKKTYKLFLEKGTKKMKIKTDDLGNFM